MEDKTITVKRNGRVCVIMDEIDDKLNNYLYKSLSYMKKNAHFLPNPFFGMVYLYNKKKRIFPTGLLNKVKFILDNWKKQTGQDYIILSGNKIPSVRWEIKETFPDLRPYQKDALLQMQTHDGGMVVLPTGAGKTITALKYLEMCEEKARKLVIVPTRDLVRQWADEIAKDDKIKNVRIATYQKLFRELKEDNDLDSFKHVIFDEAHHVSARTIYKVGMACINARIIGLTATPKRDDGEDMRLQAVLGDIIYSIPIQELVKDKYLVPAKVYIVNVPHIELTPFDEYRDIVNTCITNNEARNKLIVDIAKKECVKGTVIIMVDMIEHGQNLLDKFFWDNKKVIFVNGESKDREEIFKKAVANNYDIIIATKVYNEGINIPCIKTLILASGGKGNTKIIQQVGRILRNFKDKDTAIIYDFRDIAKIIRTHFNKRLKIYKDNGFEIIEQIIDGVNDDI
jgi:superfamily II DNA or RNA helicase